MIDYTVIANIIKAIILMVTNGMLYAKLLLSYLQSILNNQGELLIQWNLHIYSTAGITKPLLYWLKSICNSSKHTIGICCIRIQLYIFGI